MIGIFKNNSVFFDDIHLPVIESGINLVSSLILVKFIGINGVIIGTMLSNIIVIMFLSPILVFKRCFEKNVKDYICYILKKLQISGVACVVIYILLDKIVNINVIDSWISFIKEAIKMSIIVTVVTIFIFLLDKQFRNFILDLKKMKSKVNK